MDKYGVSVIIFAAESVYKVYWKSYQVRQTCKSNMLQGDFLLNRVPMTGLFLGKTLPYGFWYWVQVLLITIIQVNASSTSSN